MPCNINETSGTPFVRFVHTRELTSFSQQLAHNSPRKYIQQPIISKTRKLVGNDVNNDNSYDNDNDIINSNNYNNRDYDNDNNDN